MCPAKKKREIRKNRSHCYIATVLQQCDFLRFRHNGICKLLIEMYFETIFWNFVQNLWTNVGKCVMIKSGMECFAFVLRENRYGRIITYGFN